MSTVAANYDDVLSQLQAAGLQVDHIEIGRIIRCRVADQGREKRGWYSIHEIIANNGDALLVGSFGVWVGASNNVQKVSIRRDALSRDQLASMRKRIAEDKRRADAQQKRAAERAAAAARKAWIQCLPTGEAEYLRRKGVAAHGIRFSPSGAVVIPMLDANGLVHGLQVIRTRSQAKAEGKPEKQYWPAGVAKKAHFHLVGAPTNIVLLAEGYATGASLHEATGLPIAIAFDANNLAPVASALRKRYPTVKILICADDDAGQKCQIKTCRERVWLPEHPKTCPHCGGEHSASNAGVSMASAAAIEVGGAFVLPQFDDPPARREAFLAKGIKQTDFNDLHAAEGLHVVRAQIEARILELGWKAKIAAPSATTAGAGKAPLVKIQSVEELLDRFALVYGQGGLVFDEQEHCLITLSDMRDACTARELHRAWSEHPDARIVRMRNVGFDPAGEDPEVTCNLWGGWPTTPKAGSCEKILDVLQHMCSADTQPHLLYDWVIKWLAYPIQHPGAKMKSTLVIHGPQGTGKNMFFEAYMSIFGPYGRVIDQSAIEDRFNDWASRKLFLIADEVIARSDLYHIKNKLKAFITGEWLRINPKNVAAYDERNHVNMVFLSNEVMPVVLEEDDRRHGVIWTPGKKSPDYYKAVAHEIHNGGIEALHHHLLHLDLGDFTASTLPPYNQAKQELIDLSLDSTSRFYRSLVENDIGSVKAIPALSNDVYELYRTWCARTGERSVAPQPKLLSALKRRHGVDLRRERWMGSGGIVGPHGVCRFGAEQCPEGKSTPAWLGDHIQAFRNQLADYKGQSNG